MKDYGDRIGHYVRVEPSMCGKAEDGGTVVGFGFGGETATVRDADMLRWLAELKVSGSLRALIAREPSGAAEIVAFVPGEAMKGDPACSLACSTSPAPDLPDLPRRIEDEDMAAYFATMRDYLEREGWPSWREKIGHEPNPPPGTHPSFAMCRISSAFALAALAADDPDGGWRVEGGHPTVLYGALMKGQFKAAFANLDGGMWDRERGSWDGHYWLAGNRDGRKVIADLTADQYGWSAIEIVEDGDPRYRASYRDSTVAKDVRSLRTRTVPLLLQGWERWKTTHDVRPLSAATDTGPTP